MPTRRVASPPDLPRYAGHQDAPPAPSPRNDARAPAPARVGEPGARSVSGMPASPAERAHHEPQAVTREARTIQPVARDPDSIHKEPVRRAHDAFWRKQKRG